jgi:hypothetical protein
VGTLNINMLLRTFVFFVALVPVFEGFGAILKDQKHG